MNDDMLTTIAERDQMDATIRDITTAVARHFRELRKAGIRHTQACEMTAEFQASLLGSEDGMVCVELAIEEE